MILFCVSIGFYLFSKIIEKKQHKNNYNNNKILYSINKTEKIFSGRNPITINL